MLTVEQQRRLSDEMRTALQERHRSASPALVAKRRELIRQAEEDLRAEVEAERAREETSSPSF